MKCFWYLALSVLFLALIGCSSTMPGGLASSSMPADYGKYEVLGPASGTTKSTIILGIQTGKPDLRATAAQAVNSLNGDALINMRWYTTTTNWIILPVITVTITVEGDVIKFPGGDK
ncbi:hypothetical protein ACX8XN_18705 [Calditrichota bacterium GD2]